MVDVASYDKLYIGGKWVEPSAKLIFMGCEAIWRTRPSKSSDSNDSASKPDSHHTCVRCEAKYCRECRFSRF